MASYIPRVTVAAWLVALWSAKAKGSPCPACGAIGSAAIDASHAPSCLFVQFLRENGVTE